MAGVPFHIETSTLICSTNQWAGFYMIGIYVKKELMVKKDFLVHGSIRSGTSHKKIPQKVLLKKASIE